MPAASMLASILSLALLGPRVHTIFVFRIMKRIIVENDNELVTRNLFLKTYEAILKRSTANLGFWELAAAVRPMFNPEGWISESPAKERFVDYVNAAIKRTLD